jgi:hypothetical protein
MVDRENKMENWPPILTCTRNNSFYFLFWRTRQVLSKNLHPVLDSLRFKVPKQLLSFKEVEALFRVGDKEDI